VFLWMIFPYIFALFWAAVISVIFYPIHNRILRVVKSTDAAAGLSVVVVMLVVIIPLTGVLGLVVQQAVGIYDTLKQPETLVSLKNTAENILATPIIRQAFGDIDIEARIRAASGAITSTGLTWLGIGTRSTINTLINTLVMLYALYFFFKDGDGWLKRLMHLLPFGDDNEKVLYQKFVSTSKATLKGTILLGGIQGTIGGILFFIVGIPSAAFWGLIMIVLAIIPAVGAFIVWFPAAVYLLATGQIWQGLTLIAGGAVISVLDNLLRPPLVGKDIQMHPILILFSTIGGLGLFGVTGVVIGPIIAAFFLGLLDMYELRYKKQLDSATT